MIKTRAGGHETSVLGRQAIPLPLTAPADGAPPRSDRCADERSRRLAAMFERYLPFVWRSLRRLGVSDAGVDDAAQEVFMIAARRLDSIAADKEQSFLFGVALRIAADARRKHARRREAPLDSAPEPTAATAQADEALERHRARELLDRLVAELPDDTRPVFLLYELEGLTMAEIATFLDLAPGTVASRLRRGREDFTRRVAALGGKEPR